MSTHTRRRSAAVVITVGLWAALLPFAAAGPAAAEEGDPPPAPEVPGLAVLSPVKDTFVSAGDPTHVYGHDQYIDTYGGFNNGCVPLSAPAYGLLQFDLSSLPANATITGVRFQITSFAGYAQNGDGVHHIIDLGAQDFSEDTTNWNNRPSDGTVAPGDPTLSVGGGDIRTSVNSLGDSFVFRNTCSVLSAGQEQKNFPSLGDDQFDNAIKYATAEQHFVGSVQAAQARENQKLTLEIYNPNFAGGGNTAYWARYFSKEASAGENPTPHLVVTYATGTILQAVPTGPSSTAIAARVSGEANSSYDLHFVGGSDCATILQSRINDIGTTVVDTDASGHAYVTASVPSAQPYIGMYVTGFNGESDDTDEATGLLSCVATGPDNDAWTRALNIPLTGSPPSGGSTGILDAQGQSRWYRFDVQPGSTVKVTLSGLPADYDLALFRDIGQTFSHLASVQDLTKLSAEFSPSVFSPSVFSPSVFSPSVFSPDAYSPSVFSPSVFSPSVFSPSVFSPSVFSPSVFSPSVFSPSVFSPSVFSPSVFSPSVFSPSVFSPDGLAPSVFSPENFASAQTRSLIAVAATPGTGDESIVADTWLATGQYYVRVTGRDGAFDPAHAFNLSVVRDDLPACVGVSSIGSPPAAVSNSFATVILADPTRMPSTAAGNTDADKTAMRSKLDALAARPEVNGVVVDLSADPRVQQLQAQADAHNGCPFAKNLVAGAIKDIVDSYRTDALKYVVLVGNDHVIPFFRYPDQSLLGPESDYVPPVDSASASEASLRLNYVLGQDEYGASVTLTLGDGNVPVPDLAVGRLVENATEVSGLLDAYQGLDQGVVPAPTSPLVTGYDFLADAATSVSADLAAGTGKTVDQLIAPNNISPQDPQAWTATDLRTKLLGSRHDIAFLAGHFSANSALAADFSTSVLSTELGASPVDLTNSIVFSAGCHSGYNIVDSDAIPGVTVPLDWAEAFAAKKATLIAGTGYQYGDTDFLEYSERIYAGFAHQLRVGDGPVAVGDALARSKQDYLASTPDARGLHRKALLESALFGLPMLSVDMPAGRLPAPSDSSAVGSTNGYDTNPGLTLDLTSADLTVNPVFQSHDVPLTNLSGGDLTARYYSAQDGVVTNPAEPALPLVDVDVSVPDKVLRGVGFRGGTYTDERLVPLTGAATTELRGVHSPFASTSFFPMRLATPNYYDALDGGETRLLVTPAQHRVDNIGDTEATMRRYSDLNMRLFYSSYTDSAALSDAPSISAVRGSVVGDDIVFKAAVVGNPSAGIQSVWVTYTGDGPSRWISLDLQQCVSTPDVDLPADCTSENSTNWVGRLAGGAAVADPLRFMIQAVNGVGLVTLDDNLGQYYRIAPGGAALAPIPVGTEVHLQSPPAGGQYGSTLTASAVLTAAGQPLAGQAMTFSVGGSTTVGTTNALGVAQTTIPLNSVPGSYQLGASFAGVTGQYLPSNDASPFAISKSPTQLTITTVPPVTTNGHTDTGITATLVDAKGGPLQRTVYFVVQGPGSTQVVPVITDFLGRAKLGTLSLAAGNWTVTAQYLGSVPIGSPGPTVLTDSTYLESSASTALVLDSAAPSVTFVAPFDGAVYSRGQSVTVAYSCDDGLGGAGVKSCNGTQAVGAALNTATLGAHTFAVTAIDNADNVAIQSVNYNVVDGTKPTVSIVAPADAAQYSRNQSVTVSFSCADEVGGSGLKSCVGTQASGAGLSTATLGSHSFTVTATDNALNVTQKTVTYKVVDVTKPTVTISSPVNGATYSVGQGVTIAFTCSDDVGGAGVQSCVGTQPSGAQLATATGGTKTFTVTATDKAGNAKTASVTYKIIPSVSVPVAHLDTPKELVKVVQKVNAGAKLRVGYAFEVPGTHAAGSYTFVGPRALIAYGCVNPNITIGFATVSMANATYAIGANGGGWLPSADKKAAFQGSFVLPSLCGNGKPIYVVGLSFGTGITSTLTNQMHLRWHWQVGQSTGDWEPQVTTGPTG